MKWLNENLRMKIREVFEPRYQKSLSDPEVEEIAINLVSFTENFTRFKWRNLYGKYPRI